MSRTTHRDCTFATGNTVSTAVLIPDGPLAGIGFLHPALPATTTTLEVAEKSDSSFTTAYTVHLTTTEYEQDRPNSPLVLADATVYIASPSEVVAQDLTNHLRAWSGHWVRFRSLSASTTATTCHWHFVLDE
jgi:hypothetical protein